MTKAKKTSLATMNEYHQAFRDLFSSDRPDLDEMVDQIQQGKRSSYSYRHDLASRYAWAVPNEEALEVLAKHGPLLEIGAGGGYWASLMDARGIDILAFDNRSTHQEIPIRTWFPVLHGGTEKAVYYPRRTLFLCWPPYDNPMAEHAVRNYQGQTVIYVGEGEGGCTGTDEFHQQLDMKWTLTQTVYIPVWPGIHDRLMVYRRK